MKIDNVKYLESTNYDYIYKFEQSLKIRIRVYKLTKLVKNGNQTKDYYKISLVRRGANKYSHNIKTCNLLFYDIEGTENPVVTHVFLIKSSFQKFIRIFARKQL